MHVFVFFKQKTAYEMRISDWSSDVCASDLGAVDRADRDEAPAVARLGQIGSRRVEQPPRRLGDAREARFEALVVDEIGRASLGKECVSTCRSRWSPDHSKKTIKGTL